MKSIAFFILILVVSCCNCFGQTSAKLLLKNKNGKTRYSITEGRRTKVITLNNYNKQRYKGNLKIQSDSTILIDNVLIGLDSIYKIAKYTKSKQFTGHSIAGIGAGIFAGGIALMIESGKEPDPLIAFLDALLGSSLIGSGIVFIYVGEKTANGNLKTVKLKQKLVIQKGLD